MAQRRDGRAGTCRRRASRGPRASSAVCQSVAAPTAGPRSCRAASSRDGSRRRRRCRRTSHGPSGRVEPRLVGLGLGARGQARVDGALAPNDAVHVRQARVRSGAVRERVRRACVGVERRVARLDAHEADGRHRVPLVRGNRRPASRRRRPRRSRRRAGTRAPWRRSGLVVHARLPREGGEGRGEAGRLDAAALAPATENGEGADRERGRERHGDAAGVVGRGLRGRLPGAGAEQREKGPRDRGRRETSHGDGRYHASPPGGEFRRHAALASRRCPSPRPPSSTPSPRALPAGTVTRDAGGPARVRPRLDARLRARAVRRRAPADDPRGLAHRGDLRAAPRGHRPLAAVARVSRAAPMACHGELVLSLSRMRAIREVDMAGATVRVQAGAVTQAVHEHCADHGLTWPVDFASKGSSTVGGNIATNAGGVKVIRYGLTRQWVLGLQVVLASGEVLELGGALEKNNTGARPAAAVHRQRGHARHRHRGDAQARDACPRSSTCCSSPWPTWPASCACSARRAPRRFALSAYEMFTAACLARVLSHRKLRPPLDAPARVLRARRAGGRAARGDREVGRLALRARASCRTASSPRPAAEARDLWALRESHQREPVRHRHSPQERRRAAHRVARGLLRRAGRRLRPPLPRLGGLRLRSHRRRQPARQRDEARRDGEGRLPREDAGGRPRPVRPREEARGQRERRARDRPAEEGVARRGRGARRTWRSCGR